MNKSMRSSCLQKSSQRSSSNYIGCGNLRILKWTCLPLVCVIEVAGLDWDILQLRHAHRYTFTYACSSTGHALQYTCAVLSHSVMSDSLWPYGQQPSMPLCSRILQARILEWVVIPFSRGASQPRDWTQVSCIAGGFLPSEPPGKPIKVYMSHTIYMEREGLIQSGAKMRPKILTTYKGCIDIILERSGWDNSIRDEGHI